MLRTIAAVSVVILFSGCLMTRNEISDSEQKRTMQDQVVTLQRVNADSQNRFGELTEELRSTNGRVEALENRLQQSATDRERQVKMMEELSANNDRKIALLQEDILRLQEQLADMSQQLNAMKEQSPPNKKSRESQFELAEAAFLKKDYKKAIYHYQKFREASPKSKTVPEATYKMGLAFVELGMKDEAKVFFQEIVSKYPQSSFVKGAKSKLSKIK